MNRFYSRIVIGFALFILVAASLTLWQPAWLRRAAVDRAAAQVEASTAFHLSVSNVHFNVFSGLALHDVVLTGKQSGRRFFYASSLHLRIEWLALLHRHLRLSGLSINDPVVTVALDDAELRQKRSEGSPIALEIRRIEINNGRLVIRAHADLSARPLVVEHCNLRAQLAADALTIERLGFSLNGGRASLQGKLFLGSALKGRVFLDTENLPVERVAELWSKSAERLHLPFSGRTTVIGDRSQLTLALNGRLARSPIRLNAVRHASGWYTAKADWTKAQVDDLWPGSPLGGSEVSGNLAATGRGLYPDVEGQLAVFRPGHAGLPDEALQAQMQLKKGRGPVQLDLHYASLVARATADADLPARSVSGTYQLTVSSIAALGPAFREAAGTAESNGRFRWASSQWLLEGTGGVHNAAWQGRSVKNVEFNARADAQSYLLRFKVADVRMDSAASRDWDLKTVEGSITGIGKRIQTTLAGRFQHGETVDLAGALVGLKDRWEITLERAVLAIPSGGIWQAASPAKMVWYKDHHLEGRDLTLGQGTQSVAVRSLTWSPARSSVDLVVHLDPSAFNTMSPVTEFSKGSLLDVALKAQMEGAVMHSVGTLAFHAEQLKVLPLGLTLKHAACDIRSTDASLDITACSGQTTHGQVSLSGHSALPALQVALRGSKVDLERKKLFKGAGSLDLNLAGTVQSPELKGGIKVSEAIYNAPKKKHAPADVPAAYPSPDRSVMVWRNSVMDISLQWPRNVWYRDGASSIETRGDVRIEKTRGDTEARLTGSITSVRGNYSYLGRSFGIETGQLQFTGTPGFDPLLNIQASYPAEAIVVYLDVTGSLKDPTLKLRSSPPLSDQDIVSVIAFGQPISALRANGGTNSNQQMEAAAGSVLGSLVTSQLRDTGITPLEFDVFDVQPTSQGSQLTVGRYLSRKLYVSYGQTLASNPNKAFDADYFFKDWLMLEGETGTASGNHLDLLFRLPLNGNARESASSVLRSPFRNTLDPNTVLGVPARPAP